MLSLSENGYSMIGETTTSYQMVSAAFPIDETSFSQMFGLESEIKCHIVVCRTYGCAFMSFLLVYARGGKSAVAWQPSCQKISRIGRKFWAS